MLCLSHILSLFKSGLMDSCFFGFFSCADPEISYGGGGSRVPDIVFISAFHRGGPTASRGRSEPVLIRKPLVIFEGPPVHTLNPRIHLSDIK